MTIAIIGLGYVGLPLAIALAQYFPVIGYDINIERVRAIQQGVDPSKELSPTSLLNSKATFTSDNLELQQANFFIIAVPTDVDEHLSPDLKPLKRAAAEVGSVLKKGDYVVFESTVYPGCTEEECVPVLEQYSGLKAGTDFKVGYSPERISPGSAEYTLEKVVKVVSACDETALETIASIYQTIVKAGIHKAPSIKVAEAAKVIENTQRDLNIALMNELAMIFDRLNISTRQVLETAATKWNFLPFSPGLVGGHCIDIDPYYLAYKAQRAGYTPEVILTGRRTNEEIPSFIAKRTVQLLLEKGKNPAESKVLVMGITFKENVSDIRNSKVVLLIKELKAFAVKVEVIDPKADPAEVKKMYQLELLDTISSAYDAVIVAVAHWDFIQLDTAFFKQIMNEDPVLVDVKSIYEPEIMSGLNYWSL